MDNPRKKLYAQLIGLKDKKDADVKNYISKFSFNKFNEFLDDPEKVDKLYTQLADRGIVNEDYATFNDNYISLPQSVQKPVVVPSLLQPSQPVQQPSLTQVTGQQAVTPMAAPQGPNFQQFDSQKEIDQAAKSPVFLANPQAVEAQKGNIIMPTKEAEQDFNQLPADQQRAAIEGGTGGKLARAEDEKKKTLRQKMSESINSVKSYGADLVKSVKRGLAQGDAVQTAKLTDLATGNTEGIDFNAMAKANKVVRDMGATDTELDFAQSDGIWDDISDWMKMVLPVAIESTATLARSGLEEIGTGAAVGSVIPGVGTATGARAGVTIAGYNMELYASILDGLEEKGVDVTNPAALKKAFSDKELMSPILKQANTRAAIIGAVDLVGGEMIGNTGRMLKNAEKAGKMSKGMGRLIRGIERTRGLDEALTGSTGELAAQIGSGQDVNWQEVGLEGAGGAPIVALQGALSKAGQQNQPPTQLGGLPVQNVPPTAPPFTPETPTTEYFTVTPEELAAFKQGQVDPDRAAGISDDVAAIQKGELTIDQIDDPLYREMVALTLQSNETVPIEQRPAEPTGEVVESAPTQYTEAAGVSGSALKDVESTAKALRDNEKRGGTPIKASLVDDNTFKELNEKGGLGLNDIISEAYHKAKADGTNPELVKAVEDLLGKAPTQYTEEATPAKKESVGVSGSELKDGRSGLLNYFRNIKKDSAFDELVSIGDEMGIGVKEYESNSPLSANFNGKDVTINKRFGKTNTNTIAHEVIHGILHKLTSNEYKGSSLDLKLQKFKNELFEYIDNKGIDNLGLKPELKQLYLDYIRKSENSQEIVTFAFTNEQFHNFLSSIKSEGVKNKSKTLWGKLKDIFKYALEENGIKNKLDDLVDLLDSEVPLKAKEQPQAPTQYTEAATPAKKESEGVSGSELKDVEGKKADIERRRQEELKGLTRTTLYGTKENGEIDTNITITIEKGNPIQIDDIENSNEIIISNGKYVGRARRNSQGKWDYKIGAGGSSQLSDIELFESLQKHKIRHGKVVDTFNYNAELTALEESSGVSGSALKDVDLSNVFYHGTDAVGKIKVGDWKDSEGGAWFHSEKEGTIPYGNKVVEVDLSQMELKDLSDKTKQEAAIDYLIRTKQAKDVSEAKQIISSEDTWRKAYKGLAKELELQGFDGAKFKGELSKGNDVWILPDSLDKIENKTKQSKAPTQYTEAATAQAGSVVGGEVDLGKNTIIVNMSLPFDSGVNTGLVKNSKGAVYHDRNTSKLEKLGYSKEQIDKLSQAELDEILAKNIENPNVETSAKMPLAEEQTTTQEFLNEASKEGGRFAELAKALKQFFGIDGVETEIVKGLKDFFGKNNDGDYANNKIRIDEKAKNKLQTFLHEAIHKVTVDKLLQFERGDYSKLSKQDIEAIQNLTRIFNESKVKINEFLGGGKGDRTKGHYGFTNVHEFISEAFTNPEFQSLLKNLPTEGNNPTIFKQFLDAVAKFLGLKDASILNDIFYYTENLNNKAEEGQNKVKPLSNKGEIIIDESGSLTDVLPKRFEALKKADDRKGLNDFYSTVKILLNGPAQGKGEKAVKALEGLKNEIEAYAEEVKSVPPTAPIVAEVGTQKPIVAGNAATENMDSEKPVSTKEAATPEVAEIRAEQISGKPKQSDFTAFTLKGEAGRIARSELKEKVGKKDFTDLERIHKNAEKILRSMPESFQIDCP